MSYAQMVREMAVQEGIYKKAAKLKEKHQKAEQRREALKQEKIAAAR